MDNQETTPIVLTKCDMRRIRMHRTLPFRIWHYLADVADGLMWGYDTSWDRDAEGNWHGANWGKKGRIPFLRTIRELRGKASSRW